MASGRFRNDRAGVPGEMEDLGAVQGVSPGRWYLGSSSSWEEDTEAALVMGLGPCSPLECPACFSAWLPFSPAYPLCVLPGPPHCGITADVRNWW